MDIVKRINANNKLVHVLSEYLSKHPEQRFIQALWNLKIIDSIDELIVDRYYEEPTATLKRIGYGE